MREILYRAKRKDNREWVEGYYVKHETRQVCAIGDVLRPEEIKHYIFFNSFSDWNMPREMKFVEVIPDTVGQYTGLTDKNSTRIFEGDIVRDLFKHIGVVEFSTENIGSCGCCYPEFSGAGFKAKDVRLTNCEVIGNKFDTPELLNRK